MDNRKYRLSLEESLLRVTAAGESEHEAKQRLCRAMVAHKVEVHLTVKANGQTWDLSTHFLHRVPPNLSPGDLDWKTSQPLVPWWINPEWSDAQILLIEIPESDIDYLCRNLHPRLQSASAVHPTNAATADTPRPMGEIAARKFTRDYIRDEKQEGRLPRLAGLETAAKKKGLRGGRLFLRDEFHRIMGRAVARGRPPKDKSPKN